MAIAVLLGLTAIWLLLRPGRVRYLPWDSHARQLVRAWGGGLQQGADGVVLGEIRPSRHPVPPLRGRVAGFGRSGGRRNRSRLRHLAAARFGASGGPGCRGLASDPDPLRIYADLGLTALPLDRNGLPLPESDGDTLPAEQYLVCVAERDLDLLLPVLPTLAGGAAAARTGRGLTRVFSFGKRNPWLRACPGTTDSMAAGL